MKRSILFFLLLSFLAGASALISCNKEPVGGPAPAKVQADTLSSEGEYLSYLDVDTIRYMSTAELIANNPRGVLIENPDAERAKQWIAEHQAAIDAHAAESASMILTETLNERSDSAKGFTGSSRTSSPPPPYLLPSTADSN